MAGAADTLPARVERWIAADPDPEAQAELRALLGRGATDELAERFAHGLSFGTAGLRGRLGAGPSRMNVATVRSASAGLARYLLEAVEGARDAGVVIGHDARHGSERFAAEAAAVFSGAGLRTYRLPPFVPTPLLAFAVRHLGCSAGVMITASHNPPQDNGYKVYLGDGAQIAPPADEQIAAAIESVGAPDELPLGDGGEPVDVAEGYLAAILAALPAADDRDVRIVYTPLHGVGARLFLAAFDRAGFPAPYVVAEQAQPDPDFPTTQRPNPEEEGTLDLALDAAAVQGADVLLANDPDADRLAVAIPGPAGWRRLNGNEIGALLADFLLEHCEAPQRALLVTTVASSTLLGRMAEAAGARYAETLTGFKWMMRAVAEAPGQRLLLAYEEALGYAVSDVVRDKDGISAALVIAQLAASDKRARRTLQDRLAAIAARYGAHATDQLTLELEGADGQEKMRRIMERLRSVPPQSLLGRPLRSREELADGTVLILRADDLRVVVRPSGTEPKLKCYLEVVAGDPTGAAEQLAALRVELTQVIGAG
jgi:phosphomannomutase